MLTLTPVVVNEAQGPGIEHEEDSDGIARVLISQKIYHQGLSRKQRGPHRSVERLETEDDHRQMKMMISLRSPPLCHGEKEKG